MSACSGRTSLAGLSEQRSFATLGSSSTRQHKPRAGCDCKIRFLSSLFCYFWSREKINQWMVVSNTLCRGIQRFCNVSSASTNARTIRTHSVVGTSLRKALLNCTGLTIFQKADNLNNSSSENALKLLQWQIQPAS